MNLLDYLRIENQNDVDFLEDVMGTTKIEVQITVEKSNKKDKIDDNKKTYSHIENVDMEIIRRFKKYANNPKITKRINPEYVYKKSELTKIIIGVNSTNPLHKISFKQIDKNPDCWEINFEELL